MTEQLQKIQSALRDIVLTYINAQKIDIEPSYDTRVNSAETNIRVIANKRLPHLIYNIMKQLHITQAIEFEKPEASVQYVVQVISSITNFDEIWDKSLARWGKRSDTQLSINELFDLSNEIRENYETLSLHTAH
jgi:hypothetical protein